jgi:hypothetical protein
MSIFFFPLVSMLQVVIAGPSGVGKGTLVNLMMKHYPVILAFFLNLNIIEFFFFFNIVYI